MKPGHFLSRGLGVNAPPGVTASCRKTFLGFVQTLHNSGAEAEAIFHSY